MAALTLQDAQRKARYGRRDWVGYRDRAGTYHIARRSPQVVKAALLAIGTGGRFTLIEANTGVLHSYGWRGGVTILRNALRWGF